MAHVSGFVAAREEIFLPAGTFSEIVILCLVKQGN